MFPAAARQVFSFFDGVRDRCADPMRIRRLLQRETGGEFWHVLDLAGEVPRRLGAMAKFDRLCREAKENGTPPPDEATRPEPPDVEQFDAQDALLDAIRVAFDLPAFDTETGMGADEDTCQACLDAWMSWLSKKNEPEGDSPPTSPVAEAFPQGIDSPMPDWSGSN